MLRPPTSSTCGRRLRSRRYIGGSFGFDYYPGNGYYVDLNGSSGQYGGLLSTQVFAPGTYDVSFNLGPALAAPEALML